jgi:hypothetical protein
VPYRFIGDTIFSLVLDEAKARLQKQLMVEKLLNSYADGVNFYLYKHPEVKPALLTFEPWFPLLWTDGSIGAISTADLTTGELKSFSPVMPIRFLIEREKECTNGINGFFGSSQNHFRKCYSYINPHTTFYFRPEIQISSEEV